MRIRAFVASLPFLLVALPAGASTPALGDLSKVGTVHFPTSCSAQAQPEFLRAVALLHSFFYDEARRVFESVAERDPSCAMAHWGVAMTHFHPLWAPPSPDEIKAGLAAVGKAEALGAKTERERDYVAAIATLYRKPVDSASGTLTASCHGVGVSTVRRAEYIAALEALHKKHPKDPEAAAFYALSLLKSSPTQDEVPLHLKAAGILEKLSARNRNHPGVVHYLIHAYDYPPLAKQGLPAANHYAQIAPWVPHALHMPSHIYIRLGMWEESLATNTASAEASRAYAAQRYPGSTYAEELHAMDYMGYAYLQRGEDEKAKAIVERILAVKKTWPESDFVVAYAVGAAPARYAVERHAWQEAAALPRPPEAAVARFPFGAAHVEYVRAVGQARLGDVKGARKTLTRMKQLVEASTDARFAYFRRQMEIQQLAVSGWIALAEGRADEAIALLRYAADEDDALGKHPVSPGSIYPVRELLGDLLLELKRPAEALAAFQESLRLNPGRFNALKGAARAAELAGDKTRASAYYRDLLAQAGSSTRPEIAHARAYLDGAGVASR